MPAKTDKQRKFMGMCYGWEKEHGKRKKGCPSMDVARDFARKPTRRGGGENRKPRKSS